MIIARTPLRLSLLGGGTDYPAHYLAHGGHTLGVAIDKYSYVTVNRLAPLFDYTFRVSYSRSELVQHIDEIKHPSVRECLRFLGVDGGIEVHYVGDLPARTGLGSSSSFTVALLHALYALRGEHVSPRRLAEEACHVEQDLIHERVGVQDQYTCAIGGALELTMGTDGHVAVERLPIPRHRLESVRQHLMLLYTGVQRHAHQVLEDQLEKTRRGELTPALVKLEALAAQGVSLLAGDEPLGALGELLHEAWHVKRSLSGQVSSPAIDELYSQARRAGAIGGKIVGAGGGGFLLLVVTPDRARNVAEAVGLQQVYFGFDLEGSRILFYQEE